MDNNHDFKAKKMASYIMAVVIFLCLAISAAVFFYVKYWNIPVDKEASASLTTAGKNLFDGLYNVPSEENCWQSYVKAYGNLDLGALKSKSSAIILRDCVLKGVDSKQKKLIEKIVEKNKESVNLSKEAAKKKTLAIISEIPGTQPSPQQKQSTEDNIKIMGTLPMFLILAGDKEMEKGNYQEAAEVYLCALSFCRGLDPEGWGISMKLPVAVAVNDRLGTMLMKLPDNDPATKFILGELKRIQADIPDLKTNLSYQNYILREMLIKTIRNQNGQKGVGPLTLVMDRDVKALDGVYLSLAELADKSGYENMKKAENIKISEGTLFANIFYDGIIRYFQMYQVKKAIVNGLVYAAALKKYCVDKGEFPDKPEQLTPDYISAIPEDPFGVDGKFTYIKKGKKEAVLYSIGPDLLDNGGKECQPSGILKSIKDFTGDLVFLKLKQQAK